MISEYGQKYGVVAVAFEWLWAVLDSQYFLEIYPSILYQEFQKEEYE
jgi:hypothetical protein